MCGSHLAPGAVPICGGGTQTWPGEEPSKGHQHVANKRHATRICRRFFGCSLANATLQNYYDLYGLWECALKHTLSQGARGAQRGRSGGQRRVPSGERQQSASVAQRTWPGYVVYFQASRRSGRKTFARCDKIENFLGIILSIFLSGLSSYCHCRCLCRCLCR